MRAGGRADEAPVGGTASRVKGGASLLYAADAGDAWRLHRRVTKEVSDVANVASVLSLTMSRHRSVGMPPVVSACGLGSAIRHECCRREHSRDGDRLMGQREVPVSLQSEASY